MNEISAAIGIEQIKRFPKFLMISKIENSEGLKNADEICKFSDAIMIDRGDLSAEIGDNNLYDAILKISNLTKKSNRETVSENKRLKYFPSVPSLVEKGLK